jgi:hypothetical protein
LEDEVVDRLTPAKQAADVHLNRELPKGSARDPLRAPCSRLTTWVFNGDGRRPNLTAMIEPLTLRLDSGAPNPRRNLEIFVQRTAREAVEAGIEYAYGDAHRSELPKGLLDRLASLEA